MFYDFYNSFIVSIVHNIIKSFMSNNSTVNPLCRVFKLLSVFLFVVFYCFHLI